MTTHPSSQPEAQRALRILVAEDTHANRELMQVILEQRGHTVFFATNGEETLECLSREPFDVVLMDVKMPVLDGLNATRAIRDLPQCSQIPIIAITAHALQGDREKCLAAGMDDYLSKPIDARELIDLVERIADKRSGDSPPSTNSRDSGLSNSRMPTGATLIDREGALERMGGDASLLGEMAQFFIEDAPALLETVKTERTGENAMRAAHSLKGLASNFGATRVVELAKRLETGDLTLDARNQTIADLEPQLDLLLAELGTLAQETKPRSSAS